MRIWLALLLLAPVGASAGNLLSNPGFEPPDEGGLARAWRNNTWGECRTRFSLDSERPHSGKACQRIECVERKGGASQFLQPLKLEAGRLYRVKLWVRADGNVPWVGASLRQVPPPYTAHARAQIEPGRDWELLEFEGIPLVSEEDAGLFIWFEAEGSGTVWVDDASVEVGEAEAPGGPPPDGNVVPNGSFEVDPARTWDGVGVAADWPDTRHPAHGRRAMHFRLAKGESFRLRTPCICFNGSDEEFTLACSALARGGAASLEVQVHSAMQVQQAQPLLTLSARPDGQLQRYAARGRVASSLNGAYFLQVAGRAEADTELWLDAVSLSRKGDAFEPAAPLEVGLSVPALAGILAPDGPAKVKLEVFSSGAPRQGSILLQVRDYLERLVAEKRVTLPLGGGAFAAREVALPIGRLGAFRVDAFTDAGKPPLASLVLSIIPRPGAVPPERSVVGGHFSTASDWQMRAAVRLGYRWTRIHDCSQITHWRASEPEPGQWRFFDDEVRRVRAAGLSILGEFLRVPDWATKAEKGSRAYDLGVGPYRDAAEFERYVRTVVAHYKPWIRDWEIWNEPYGDGFWGGTPEEYGAMALAAARAARGADPGCRLLGPCTFPSTTEWTSRAIAAGAIAGVDIFSYHGYGCLSKAPYDRVNEWAVRGGKPLPRWNTETGISARSFYRHTPDMLKDSYTQWLGAIPVEDAVHQTLKLFVLAIAGGSERFFTYWTNVEPGMCPRLSAMSIFEYDRSVRPNGVAYAIAASLLDPCKGAGIRELPRGVTCCLLERDKESVAVVWAKTRLGGGTVTLSEVAPGTRALDTMGNPLAKAERGILRVTLTKAPLYLVAPKGSGARIAARLESALQ